MLRIEECQTIAIYDHANPIVVYIHVEEQEPDALGGIATGTSFLWDARQQRACYWGECCYLQLILWVRRDLFCRADGCGAPDCAAFDQRT